MVDWDDLIKKSKNYQWYVTIWSNKISGGYVGSWLVNHILFTTYVFVTGMRLFCRAAMCIDSTALATNKSLCWVPWSNGMRCKVVGDILTSLFLMRYFPHLQDLMTFLCFFYRCPNYRERRDFSRPPNKLHISLLVHFSCNLYIDLAIFISCVPFACDYFSDNSRNCKICLISLMLNIFQF